MSRVLGRNRNRLLHKIILDSLHALTGSDGGSPAESIVRHYRTDPIGTDTAEFAFCTGLTLKRWYIDPAKPNQSEERALWTEIWNRLGVAVPAGPDDLESTTMIASIRDQVADNLSAQLPPSLDAPASTEAGGGA